MKYLKRIDESLFLPGDHKSFTDDQSVGKIYITKKNSPNKSGVSLKIYLEDGELKPAKFIICYGMSDGYSRGSIYGTYPISAEHIDTLAQKTRDGEKTFFKYRLNGNGMSYFRSMGVEIPSDFDLVDEEYIQNLITQNEMSIEKLQRGVENYRALLGK